MSEFRYSAPVVLWRGSYEHLHEVDEREEYAEGHHDDEEELLVASHVADVAEHCVQRVRVIFRLFGELFFGILVKKRKERISKVLFVKIETLYDR